ncbi:MAG: hypothetical protein Kow00105_05120 [Phycisphaeraceae bacterium]
MPGCQSIEFCISEADVSYTVLARRYRSTSFSGVIGQEPIAKTLRNAIAQGRVAHAYLFTGTRGVGKTSMARIFARALNAPATVEDAPLPPDAKEDDYPPQEVQQRMAEAIMRGEDLNVIEIDGASNNSVDQARQLIANASLAPTGNARYKVYIIDEVHMLSNSAFNALLKTMEEPPAHVKFILCTTDPHKVPRTIQSRCQVFDFRNIPTPQIADHLARVLENEAVEADRQVVWQVARLANGSMRDGLSLLERLIATGQTPLTLDVLEQMFGLPDAQLIDTLVDAIADGDVKASLETVNQLVGKGTAQDQLLETLIERFHQLMLIAACGPDSELVELSEEARAKLVEQAGRFDAAGLTYFIAICENVQRVGKSSAAPRALFDALIVRLTMAEKMADVAALLSSETGGAGSGRQKKKPADDHRTLTPSPALRSAPSLASAPEAETASTSVSEVAPSDLSAVTAELHARAVSKPALAWLRYVTVTKLDDHVAVLMPTPGHREVMNFARDQRRLQDVSTILRSILGRRLSVSIAVPEKPGQETQVVSDESDNTQAGLKSSHNGTKPFSAGERRAALDLPLVKQVMDVFPDAILFDIRDDPGES